MRLFLILCVITIFGIQPAFALGKKSAQTDNPDEPVHFSSDNVSYNDQDKTYLATGKVKLVQNGRTLIADKVTYDAVTGKAIAIGHVRLIEKDGNILSAKRMELDQGFKKGLVEQLRICLVDNSRIIATTGERITPKLSRFKDAQFSPCSVCVDKIDGSKDASPLWELNASEIIDNEETGDMDYYDAWLDFGGVPIFYTPYFSHPSPGVKRRSGFLMPNFTQSSSLGFVTRVPYYIAPSPSYDVTLEPIITTERGDIMASEYRQRLSNGNITMSGSRTVYDQNENDPLESHLFVDSNFDLGDGWKSGFDYKHTSDRTYLKRYGFSNDNVLISKAYVDNIHERDYTSISGYQFQGLRDVDNRGQTPLVLPLAEYHKVTEPDQLGVYKTLDARARAISRSAGDNSQGVTVVGGINKPFKSDLGDFYDVALSVQGDAYATDNNVTDVSKNAGRVFPQASVTWHYPFARQDRTATHVIEPVVSIVGAPTNTHSENIPNEDSKSFIFDETNLLSPNRFTGLDRLTSGSRIDYGLHYDYSDTVGQKGEVFLGQSYRLSGDDDLFSERSGLHTTLSDYVGKLRYSPSTQTDFIYRFRFDEANLHAARNGLSVNHHTASYWVDSDYIYSTDDNDIIGNKTQEQIGGEVGAHVSKHWSVASNAIRSLAKDDTGMRNAGVKVLYGDECLLMSINANRQYTYDEDLQPEDSIKFNVILKNLSGADTVKNFEKSNEGIVQ